MKIIVVNDLLICGGAEKISLNIKKLLEKEQKNEVYFLSFDDKFQEHSKALGLNSKTHINIKTKKNKLNKLIFNPILYCKIRKVLKILNPDIIVVNAIFCAPITQLKALKGYKAIQVIHDYSIVCPKSTCIDSNCSVCSGYKENKCIKRCTYHDNKINIILKLYQTKRIEKIRKHIIKKLISPSKKLNEYLIEYGYDATVINNSIQIPDERNFTLKGKNSEIIKYIYVGGINKRKGIIEFLEIFNEFSKHNNVSLEVIGKSETQREEQEIKEKYKANKKIIFKNYMPNQDVIKKIKISNYVVVPSIWMENYPTIVLEAMSCKTCVLGSNRGGIPELLEENRGFLFDILNKEDVIKTLQITTQLKPEEYKKITDQAYRYIVKNNSEEIYLKKLNSIINEIGARNENIDFKNVSK